MGFSLSITLSVILISFSKIENFVDAEENETQKKKKINEYNMLLVDNFNKKKIKFISTPYDLESVEILKSLKTKIYKTASADISDYLLHKKLSKLNKKVMIKWII